MVAEHVDPHALISALQSAPSSVAVFDGHGELIFHTHQLERDMPQIKNGLIYFLDSLTKEHSTDAILNALEECAEVDFVARHEGDKRIWEIRMNGGPHHQITPVFIRDVSQREEREKINRILLELVENSLDPIGIARADLRALYINPAMRKLFGAPIDTSTEQLRVEHLQPDNIGPYPLHEALKKAQDDGPFYTETTILRPYDDTPVDVSQLLMAHRDPLDDSLYYSTSIRDISAAKQLQSELNRARLELEKLLMARTNEWLKSSRQAEYAQRLWQSLVDKNVDLIVLTADDGEILYANQGFIATGGLELIGVCIFDLIDSKKRQEALQQFSHCMLENQGHFSFEAELQLADGSGYFCLFSVNYVPQKDAGHAATWMISDMTAERQAREQLAISEQMAASGRMAARVAHEINNPLAAIQNSVSLIRMDIPSGSEAREYLDLMERELKRVANIIRQMYGLYRPQDEAPTKLALSHICEEVTMLLSAQAGSRNISLEVRSSDEVFAQVTESSVRQVLYNVIINAVDASPDNSAVVIHLYRDSDNAVIDIIDQGKGVSPADAAKFFEPFYTTKETFSGQGLGLGLSVSASIIRGLGGKISLSPAEREGTLCRIVLPLENSSSAGK